MRGVPPECPQRLKSARAVRNPAGKLENGGEGPLLRTPRGELKSGPWAPSSSFSSSSGVAVCGECKWVPFPPRRLACGSFNGQSSAIACFALHWCSVVTHQRRQGGLKSGFGGVVSLQILANSERSSNRKTGVSRFTGTWEVCPLDRKVTLHSCMWLLEAFGHLSGHFPSEVTTVVVQS
ncbi:hypothetical protein VTK26DRAFT_9527 [Humicola hyalothermophila]